MELPLDHFRLLGVSPVATEELVLRTLSQRLDRPPEGGFTTDALECRADLLRSSADLLCDSERREEYECLLTELNAESPDTLPALEVPSSQEVGGLILLMEAGQPAEAFEGARQALQPPQAPALGSNREADLSLLAALSAQKAGQERCRDRRFESAAQILHNGIQLLQRMGQQHEQRVRLESDLNALLPYRILDLISRDLAESGSREFGRDLLNELVQRRGGLDGDQDPDFPQESFQSFFQQIRGFLTVQEQIDLFLQWGESGSVTAEFLSAYALTASGFAQRKPERIGSALERLQAMRDVGVDAEMACLHLLLGQTDEAAICFERGSDAALKAWAKEQGSDPLAGLCVYCSDWLKRQVLPCYRDLDADPDLEAYFADRDVQAFIESSDRKRQRAGVSTSEPITSFEVLPTPDPSEIEEILEPLSSSEEEATPVWRLWQEQAQQAAAQLQLRISELQERLQATTGKQRSIAAASAAGLTAAVFAGVAISQRPSVPAREALLLPEAPLQLDSPLAKLNSATPAEETEVLLQLWLDTKATLLDGTASADQLKELASAELVQYAKAGRALDAASGKRRKVNARVQTLELSSDSPERRVAKATIQYEEKVLSDDGELLGQVEPKQIKNTYVYEKKGDSWQLTDFRPSI
ncbi:MAG: IMS domain-containing protein [Synechococcus sp.]